jgi:hypothetical protein
MKKWLKRIAIVAIGLGAIAGRSTVVSHQQAEPIIKIPVNGGGAVGEVEDMYADYPDSIGGYGG